MTSREDPVLPTVTRARAPQADHSLLFLINPQEHDVPGRVTIGEREPDHFAVKGLRGICVRDGDVCFVKVHTQESGLSKPRASVNARVSYRKDLTAFGQWGFSSIRCKEQKLGPTFKWT